MEWKEIREKYPNSFVLVEALKAKSENQKRIIQELSVIKEFQDSKNAWDGYKEFHREDPKRELYIFHTNNESIEVIEGYFSGIRSKA